MNDLEIADGLFATPQRFLWHPASATAVLADVHLGAEAELTRRGIFMPDVSSAALQTAWDALCQRLASIQTPTRLIIAGDLFDTPVPDSSGRTAAQNLIARLPPNGTVTLLSGNHDPAPSAIKQIFSNLPVQVETAGAAGGYRILHGHEIPHTEEKMSGLIVGHQHPAVVLRDRVQSAKMICYAVCRSSAWNGPLVLLPSFSRAPLGSNLLTEQHWIIDLPRPADADVRIAGIIEPTDAAAGVLDFGPLNRLRLPF